MSPDLIGVLIGVPFVAAAIWLFRNRRYEDWAWPATLASLPLYYMAMGALASDSTAVMLELLYGLPYIALGIVLWRRTNPLALVLLGVAWLSHGLYDFFHDVFFVNPGVFAWYPVFCAVVDLAVGGYLILLANSDRLRVDSN